MKFAWSVDPEQAPGGAARFARGVRAVFGLLSAAVLLIHTGAGVAHAQVVGVPVAGTIDSLKVYDITDPWSGGEIVVGGTRIIIPKNVLIDLPANRLTLTDLMLDGPAQCFNQNPPQSGVASEDSCLNGRPGGYATIMANRIECGDLIAGDVFIDKSLDTVAGVVTFVSHTDGYFRVNGAAGANSGGTIVRINDPSGRHTLQQGLGCGTEGNCSADGRFAVDADNYTVTFTTGYPVCIPSTMVGGLRIPANVSNVAGVGDAFCPSTNRGGTTVANSTRFAPLQAGDRITAGGNFEVVNGTRLFSAFRMEVAAALVTRDEPGQPDYVSFAETGWDAPGFDNLRVRLLLIGRSTLTDSQIDIYALDKDPRDNTNHERILASTVNNLNFTNQGIGATAGGIWKVNFDVDFVAVRQDARRAPCATLAASAPSPIPPNWANFIQDCLTGGTLFGDFRILSPLTREIIAHTRRRLPVTAFARDIQGLETPSSQYLTPIGSPGFPEMDEVDLSRLAAPFNFSGVPWLLDRRLSPGGCSELGCESTPQPLGPFPFEGAAYHPGQQILSVPEPNRPLTYFTYDNGVATPHVLAWPPATPACTPGGGGGGTGGGGTGGGGGAPAPVANNDLLLTPAGAPLAFTAAQLLGNDSGTGLTLLSVDFISTAGGTISGGGGSFTFTPRANFAGNDTFSYTVQDVAGATATATVRVTVTDAIAPTVIVTSPTAGQTVSGTVTITAAAADNFSIAGVNFFVDGVPLGIADNVAPYSAAWNTVLAGDGSHVIGAQSQDINGNVSNVVTVTVGVNNAPPPPPPSTIGLVLALFFDEAAGATANDSSGGGRNGTISAATRVAGKVGGALSFNGTTSIVNVPDSAALDLTTAMTLEAWVNPTQLSGWETVLLKGNGAGSGLLSYALYAHDGAPLGGGVAAPAGYVRIGGDQSLRGATQPPLVPLNTWTHLALTYDGTAAGGTVMRLYVNGTLAASRTQTGTIPNGNGPLAIGGNAVFGNESFNGLIDEVRVYNRALTAADIVADMNAIR